MATLQTVHTRASGSDFPAGKAYFETSTNNFIVWNGSQWIELHSDGVGALDTINFASDNAIAPSTEQEIAALTGYEVGTYALNSDGSAFYVYNGSGWNIFNPYN